MRKEKLRLDRTVSPNISDIKSSKSIDNMSKTYQNILESLKGKSPVKQPSDVNNAIVGNRAGDIHISDQFDLK